MRNLAVIPARGGSKRVPKKNIRNFLGRPMISYALEAAVNAEVFDKIHVSTDDPEIQRVVVEDLNHAIDFFRDPALADDTTPMLEVARWVLRQYADRGENFDVITMIMPCSPLITGADLRRAVETFTDGGGNLPVLSVTRSATPIERAFVKDEDGAIVAKYPSKLAERSQDLPVSFFDTGSFSVFCTRTLLASDDATARRFLPFELPPERAVDIDELEDFGLAEILYLGAAARSARSSSDT